MWRLKQFMPTKEQGGNLEGKHVDVGDLKLQVRSIIAQGGFSCVYLARESSGGKTYALKHIICNDMESVELVKKEVSVMKALRGHPNVVTLHAQVVYDLGRTKECFLAMEYCHKMLANVLENRGAGFYDEKQILSMFLDICNAVYAMHCQSPPVAHRDLKVENVLMGPDGLWKLCDFGSTSINHKHFDKPDEMGLEEDYIRKFTTPAYRAPEMWDLYQKELISEKVDIWALGCLLYRISYLKSAFDGESKLQILNCNYRIPDVPRYSFAITGLIRDMLNPSPEGRPDVMQVWQRVNEALPPDLRKGHPDKAPSTHTPKYFDIGGSSEGAKASISAPSGAPFAHLKEAEQRPSETGVTNNLSPKGAFWSTHHAQSAKADEHGSRQEKGGRNKTSPPAKLASPPVYLNNSPPKEVSPFPRKTAVAGTSRRTQGLMQTARSWEFVDSEVEQSELRQDSNDEEEQVKAYGGVASSEAPHLPATSYLSPPPHASVPLSPPSGQKYAMPESAASSNEAFTAFVADFSQSVVHSRTNEQLKAEVDRLHIALKQALSDKSVIASKYEKLTNICRSQRQEIQDLKSALDHGTAKGVTSAKDRLLPNTTNSIQPESIKPQQQQNQYQQAGARQTLEQAVETQSGTIWDLQEGLSSNPANQQSPWEAFGDPPYVGKSTSQDQGRSLGNSSGMTADRHPRPQQHSSTNSRGAETWKLAQDRTPPASSGSHGARSPVPLAGGSSSSSNASPFEPDSWAQQPTNRVQPAGWAGF